MRLVLRAAALLSLAASAAAVEQRPPPHFVNDIVPILTKADCNSGACHAKADVGQRGFRLSLLGFEPQEDYEHIVKEAKGRRVFPPAPEQSLLVLKAQVGAEKGRWKPVYMDFVKVWLATVAVFILCVVGFSALIGILAGSSIALVASQSSRLGLWMFVIIIVSIIAGIFMLILASAPARAYREARMFQLMWNNIGVSQVARFKCHLKSGSYVGLRIKNMLLTLLTLGLYRPFARVSEYRMKCESVTLHVKGGVEQVAGAMVRQQQGGLGDALADAAGLDLIG